MGKIQDAKKIIKDTRDLPGVLLSKFPNVEGIGITGQMHGIVYLDSKANILGPLYTWQDGMSRLEIKDNLTYVEDLKEKTGHKIYAGYGLATHYYNRINGLIPASTKYISTISDYFAMNLCHRDIPRTDYSNAASLGFLIWTD